MTHAEVTESNEVFRGKVFSVVSEMVREGDAEHAHRRDIVKHRGSAVIVPLHDDGSVSLIKQYRHAVGRLVIELPAGSLEVDEDPLACAARELTEELGLTADTLEKVAEFMPSPGYCSEVMHIYRATGLTEGETKFDGDEDIEAYRVPLTEAKRMVRDGQITDGKTVVGLLMI